MSSKIRKKYPQIWISKKIRIKQKNVYFPKKSYMQKKSLFLKYIIQRIWKKYASNDILLISNILKIFRKIHACKKIRISNQGRKYVYYFKNMFNLPPCICQCWKWTWPANKLIVWNTLYVVIVGPILNNF